MIQQVYLVKIVIDWSQNQKVKTFKPAINILENSDSDDEENF